MVSLRNFSPFHPIRSLQNKRNKRSKSESQNKSLCFRKNSFHPRKLFDPNYILCFDKGSFVCKVFSWYNIFITWTKKLNCFPFCTNSYRNFAFVFFSLNASQARQLISFRNNKKYRSYFTIEKTNYTFTLRIKF